ncbi:DUF2231 domain-containing protein [Paenibacillus roseipurpureus]|uniref:DUF2231 domain-containing protein n=1 Tax=Paenibacillus roseopurpureus TaxID=2918901 RepID=A0AA96LPV3_9BACL|nr:DUF2231 domain-containing protein [Paenibacillus sp. MBLB1832]WNR44426.1 hypothetical protein MJB10_25745 [Paenibacillus sp. MBLB1832]
MDYIMKNLHFIFTHVPIALLIFSFVFDVAALSFKKKEWHSAGMLCLVVGALGAVGSVLTGPESRNTLLSSHEFYAKLTMVVSIVLAVVRVGLLIWKKLELGRNVIYLVVSLVVVLLVSYTGHLGGKMVHRDMQGGPPGMQGGPGGGGNGQMQGGQRQGGSGAGGQQRQGQQQQGGQASPAPAK